MRVQMQKSNFLISQPKHMFERVDKKIITGLLLSFCSSLRIMLHIFALRS